MYVKSALVMIGWCVYCPPYGCRRKDFMPLWEDVSMQMKEEDPKGKRKLVMGKFDCEQVCPIKLERESGTQQANSQWN